MLYYFWIINCVCVFTDEAELGEVGYVLRLRLLPASDAFLEFQQLRLDWCLHECGREEILFSSWKEQEIHFHWLYNFSTNLSLFS